MVEIATRIPMSTEPKRYDLLIVPQNLSQRLAPGVCISLLKNLATLRIIRPVEESLAEEWSEVYCDPGDTAHDLFVKGVFPYEDAIFLEAVVRFGMKTVPMPYGHEGAELNFFVEFRGCLFNDTLGVFKKRFKDITHVVPAVYWREHTELPPHLEVPEGEEPVDKKKKKGEGPSLGGVGTRAEEW
jgi:hypothetical protein